MTPEKFYTRMKTIQESYSCDDDLEFLHREMDRLMCDCLEDLGYEDGVKVFQETDKWYA